MEIVLSKDIETLLEGYFDLYKSSKQDSLNYIWTSSFKLKESIKWSKLDYENLVNNLDDSFEDVSNTEDILVITSLQSNDQYEIKSIGQITQYCLNEDPTIVEGKWLKPELIKGDLLPDEFPLDINLHLRSYPETENPDLKVLRWKSLEKHYRFYKKYSYKHEDDNIILHIYVIRQTQDIFKSMYESNVAMQPIEYEFEIEYNGPCQSEKVKPADFAKKIIYIMLKYMIKMVQVLKTQIYPLSKTQQEEVLRKYDEIIEIIKKGSAQVRNYGSDDDSQRLFLAPKPLSLEQIHLIEPGPETYGINSVLKDYTVTDKADGERMLMYISKEGNAFLINNTFEVFDTGLITKSTSITNSLIDGEYISTLNKNIFAAFDIYCLNNRKILDFPLVAAGTVRAADGIKNRYAALQHVCDPKLWKGDTFIDFRCKNIVYAEGAKMRKACKDILDNEKNLEYKIDGLIFTPAELGVFSYYPRETASIRNNVKWEKVLKWKPPSQNTIDFLVEYIGETIDIETNVKYGRLKLKIGYNLDQWEPITPFEGLRRRYDIDYQRQRERSTADDIYKPQEFIPFTNYEKGVSEAWVPLQNQHMICDDNSIIENNSIVEFSYNVDETDKSASMRWNPLRVRTDKTKLYQSTGKISKTANDLVVAMSVWRLIHKPVLVQNITGTQDIEKSIIPDVLEDRLLSKDDIYYAREIPRQHMLSVNMLNFHNQGVKKFLYQKAHESKRESLLELACGMAGDMYNWRDAGYSFILGIDYVQDNITKAKDGAYARMLNTRSKQYKGYKNDQDILFAVGDCALPLETGEAAGEDDESKKVLRILFNKHQKSYPPYLKKFAGKAANGFDVVSCQFAIHYFFHTEEKLNSFMRNIAQNLRQGGIFIATFMDGMSVHKLLETGGAGGEAGGSGIIKSNSDKRVKIEGRKIDNKIPVWAIIRRYTTFGESDSYGKNVDVFLENTNRLIPEFLVNFNTLIEKAKSFGLELESSELFSENYKRLRAKVPSDRKKWRELDSSIMSLENDEVQKQFSFLNRWAVFKKL